MADREGWREEESERLDDDDDDDALFYIVKYLMNKYISKLYERK